jgi:hypothetical protein
MTKHVFRNNMVAHVWAQRNQSHGRSSNGHFYFEGDTIYSYGTHFPIAKFYDTARGPVVLFTTKGYSVTTSAHMSRVSGAIPAGIPIYHVPEVYIGHHYNARDYGERYMSLITQAARARKSGEYLLGQAIRLAAECRDYCAAFDVPCPDLPEIKEETLAEARRIAAESAKAKAEQERKRRERDAAALVEKIAEWRAGSLGDYYPLRHAPCMLRVRGETVETSWGADFPADHARKVWPAIRRLYASGSTYRRNGHAIHLGHFTIDGIAGDGTVRAGCHTVPRAEVERIAAELGLPPVPPAGADLAQAA